MDQKCSILIVEDDISLASNLQDVLEEEGYKASVVCDGQTALVVCRDNGFDLAFIDIKLPDLGGVDLVEKLASLTPATEYIMITGYPSVETAIASVGLKKIVAYETKPLDMGRVTSLIKQFAERRRVEGELRRERDLAQRYLDVAGVMLIAIGADEKVSMVNRRGCTILECSEDDIIGKNWFNSFLPKGIREETRATFRKQIAGVIEPVEYSENPVLTKNGAERIVAWHNTVLTDVSGSIIGTLSSGEDITERKRAEDQLKLEAQLLDAATDSIFLHDIDGSFRYLNESAYRSRGYSKDELMARSLYTLTAPKHRRLIRKLNKELMRKGKAIFESAHVCSDHSIMPVEVQARIVESDDRKLILSVARDTTERKRGQEELERSYRKLQRAMEGTTMAFELATEMRDPYTSGHQRRATRLACAIAKEMGASKEQVEELHMAGAIHDVGKMYVPAEILSKPGPLTDAEFTLIKVHPKAGHDILNAAEATSPVAEIVLQHHERMDGSGYPCGLSGEDILLEARILAVADVVEAMSSHRPYRPAYPTDKALLEIVRKKGVLYDCDAVDACMDLFSNQGFKFD